MGQEGMSQLWQSPQAGRALLASLVELVKSGGINLGSGIAGESKPLR